MLLDNLNNQNLIPKSPAEICPCGHPVSAHFGGPCQVSPDTCHCRHAQALFIVSDVRSFFRPHYDLGVGHALTQGVIWHGDGFAGITLSSQGYGKRPECYRCRRVTHCLTPIIVNRHSVLAVKNLTDGKMTRLWCDRCCELEGIEYIPYVGFAIKSALERRGGLRL